uniref:Uncharacterized protein n=1 Tax=Arundo donax TaxID=35708 RepID=A0A0A8Y966_ARUDO
MKRKQQILRRLCPTLGINQNQQTPRISCPNWRISLQTTKWLQTQRRLCPAQSIHH